MVQGKHFSGWKLKIILDMIKDGYDRTEIADAMNCAPGTISCVAKRYGLPMQKRSK